MFSLSPPSSPSGNWIQKVLYRFDGRNGDRAETPLTNLAIGSGGALSGTTGAIPTAFSLAPPSTAGGAWTETVLATLGSNQPRGSLIMSPTSGIIFGASSTGGSSQACGTSGCGTVLALAPPSSAGDAWTFAVLHSSEGTDGSLPWGGVSGASGALYGTTLTGGTYGAGTVFAITE